MEDIKCGQWPEGEGSYGRVYAGEYLGVKVGTRACLLISTLISVWTQASAWHASCSSSYNTCGSVGLL